MTEKDKSRFKDLEAEIELIRKQFKWEKNAVRAVRNAICRLLHHEEKWRKEDLG